MPAKESRIPDPILVTGPPRSGTSLIAGIINICGAWGGNMISPHPENPRGFFENTAIKESVFEPYLFGMEHDLLGRRELPAIRSNRNIPRLKQKIQRIMIMQGYKGGPWFYKNPMMCLVWQAWTRAFPKAKWIFVRRDAKDNAKSCINTSWMGGLSSSEEWESYVQEYNNRMDLMRLDVDHFDIWPQKAIDGEFSEIKEAIKWLGLKWQKKKIENFII